MSPPTTTKKNPHKKPRVKREERSINRAQGRFTAWQSRASGPSGAFNSASVCAVPTGPQGRVRGANRPHLCLKDLSSRKDKRWQSILRQDTMLRKQGAEKFEFDLDLGKPLNVF